MTYGGASAHLQRVSTVSRRRLEGAGHEEKLCSRFHLCAEPNALAEIAASVIEARHVGKDARSSNLAPVSDCFVHEQLSERHARRKAPASVVHGNGNERDQRAFEADYARACDALAREQRPAMPDASDQAAVFEQRKER